MAKPSKYSVRRICFLNYVACLSNNLLDPATNEELGTVPDMGVADTKRAIEVADAAFKTWSKTTAKVRIFRNI